MRDKKTFGSFIKEKRINKNYSQKELADLLYVTESAVSKWERGVTYPDITLITDICRVLEISEKELIQSSDDFEYRKMKKEADKFKKIKATLFWIINSLYIVALLTCFIVNLAVNHTLSWFFIVLSSLVVAYTFIPTITYMFTKYKKYIFFGSVFLSLFILFLTCSIYTSNYWFMIPTLSLLLLYFIIFYPILLTYQKNFLDEDKYKKLSKLFLLTYSLGILFLIILLMVFIYIYNSFNLGLGIIIVLGIMSIPIILGGVSMFSSKYVKLFGFIILLIALLGAGVISFNAIRLKANEVENTYTINEEYQGVYIDVTTSDVNIYLSDTNENKVTCIENNKISFNTKVENNILTINEKDERKFYDKLFSISSFEINLYLSNATLKILNITLSTGDINIAPGFNINNANIKTTTGDIEIESNITDNLEIKNSTGDIEIEKCDNLGDVDIITNTGDIDFENVNCKSLDVQIRTGKTTLSNVLVTNDLRIEGTTGDVYLNKIDAENIYITLSTGDVIGSILSNKIFNAHSDTGNVAVPSIKEGGECNISTSTGEIIITIQ